MKHSIGLTNILFSVLTAHAVQAQEAWYLEMEPRFAEALVAKYQAKEKAPYQQALAKLPDLIKQGKIKEIEKVGVANKKLHDKEATGGIHFPKKTVTTKIYGNEDIMDLGSSYWVREKGIYYGRVFEFKWQEGPKFTHYEIASLGALPNQWMPTFLLETEDHTRVLLEKSPVSEDAFHEMNGRLSVATEVPEKLTVTWLLTRGTQEVLDNREHDASAPLFSFRDGWTDVHKGEGRELGSEISWQFSKDKVMTFALENTTGKSGKYDTHRSEGEIQKPGVKQKAEIKYHEERPDDTGDTEIRNEKTNGFADFVYQISTP